MRSVRHSSHFDRFPPSTPTSLPPGSAGCSRSSPRRSRPSCRRAAALDHVRPLRSRRVRCNDKLAAPTGRRARTSWLRVDGRANQPRPLERSEYSTSASTIRNVDTPRPHGWTRTPSTIHRHHVLRRPAARSRRRATTCGAAWPRNVAQATCLTRQKPRLTDTPAGLAIIRSSRVTSCGAPKRADDSLRLTLAAWTQEEWLRMVNVVVVVGSRAHVHLHRHAPNVWFHGVGPAMSLSFPPGCGPTPTSRTCPPVHVEGLDTLAEGDAILIAIASSRSATTWRHVVISRACWPVATPTRSSWSRCGKVPATPVPRGRSFRRYTPPGLAGARRFKGACGGRRQRRRPRRRYVPVHQPRRPGDRVAAPRELYLSLRGALQT